MFAGLRLSMRIARREALRYKGRSALSIALLGLPLLGVSIGATAYDTIDLSDEEEAVLYLGDNDAFVESAVPGIALTQYDWNSKWVGYSTEKEVDEETLNEAYSSVHTEADLLAELPAGTQIAPYSFYNDSGVTVTVETPDGIGELGTLGYDLANGVYEAAGWAFLEGAAPGGGEVAVTEAAADYLDLGVGDDLVIEENGASERLAISGIVEIPWNLRGQFAIAPGFDGGANGWLVDLPGEFTYEQSLALNEIGATVWATALVVDPPPPPPDAGMFTDSSIDTAMLTIYALIIVVVVMEVVLLAGPAFAISARRRTREFALMSANGASPAQIRNTVLAGGLLFGLIAAVVAVALGIVLVLVGLPFLEQLFGYRTPGLRVLPTLQAALVAAAIATGLLSALTAALSASRVNVVAALMGRTPGRKGSKRWLFIGLGTVAAGVASGLGGVALWNVPLMALAIVLAQLGLVACTPAILAGTARLGRWLPLAPRMALREAGRNRGSAAPAIAAVLGVVAAGVALSMVVTADQVRMEQNNPHDLRQDSLTLTMYSNAVDESVSPDWNSGLVAVEPLLRRHLTDLELVEIPLYTGWGGCGTGDLPVEDRPECNWELTRPEEHRCSYWDQDLEFAGEEERRKAAEIAREDPNCNEGVNDASLYFDDVPGSSDPTIVSAYTELEGDRLDEALAVLDEGGVLVSDAMAITEAGTVVLERTLTRWDEGSDRAVEVGEPVTLEVPAMVVADHLLAGEELFLSPAAAEQMDLARSGWSRTYLLETSTEVDGSVIEAVRADVRGDVDEGAFWVDLRQTDYSDLFAFYVVLLVTALCSLIALGATAVSTGLIIAEQRQDMTTLGAVGAAPGLRKRFAMWQTVVIALFGAGLGTVAGVLGYTLIRQALNDPLRYEYPFAVLYGWELPWVSIGITLAHSRRRAVRVVRSGRRGFRRGRRWRAG
ncbi:FtsX-like permease family protein [Glycomyces sp. NRRL B-16210]|uniref:FtsX-like permease family protein n=1 Tax=Glycomyces sp. NRRL B-16210 TaxID=1463821 RepID=UPI0004C2B061|nr:FtsX-like permease family protein [Glycomyces sp. NRRL B-16210]